MHNIVKTFIVMILFSNRIRTQAYGPTGVFPGSPLGSPASPYRIVSPRLPPASPYHITRLPPSDSHTRPGSGGQATSIILHSTASQLPSPATMPPVVHSGCHSPYNEVCIHSPSILWHIFQAFPHISIRYSPQKWT